MVQSLPEENAMCENEYVLQMLVAERLRDARDEASLRRETHDARESSPRSQSRNRSFS